ncbi:MAG: VTT domain-containing protein [Pseudomonadota bacterium]
MLDIITEFGVVFLVIGTFVEGETTLILAGIMIQEGTFTFSEVVVISLLASYSSHLSFYIPAYFGADRYLKKLPRLQAKISKINGIVRRYETSGVFVCQYLIGLRLASAMAFGLAGMRPLKYGLLQLISCLIWVLIYASLGYLFGYSIEFLIKDMKKILLPVMIVTLLVAWGGKRVLGAYFKRRI